MDNIDNIIENVMQKTICEPEEYKQAILTAFENKNQYNVHSNIIIKIISAITAFLTITAGIVFAKDISNWIYNIFNPETIGKGVVDMAEKGYIQNTNMDFIESNGVSVKVDNILMDDYNLDIVFEVKTEKDIESIYNIKMPDLIIYDENNKLIFCSDNKNLYEEFCKKHNIEFSEMNMKNNLTNRGYQIEVIEREDKSIKFLFKMYSDEYPKSKKLTLDFKNIELILNNRDVQEFKGNWKIEIELPEKIYNREVILYNVKDNSDKENNTIFKEARGSYTEMHLTILVKGVGIQFEPTEEGITKFFEMVSLKDEVIPTLENEEGKIFERSISSSDSNGGTTYHPNGDITMTIVFPITKEDYTDTLKLNLYLTKTKETITINLSK